MTKKNMAIKKPDIQIEYFTDKVDNDWDSFVNEINGEIHQTSLWAEYVKFSKGWHNHRIVLKRGNDIIAGSQIKIINVRFLGKIGYIQFGPYIKEKTPEIITMMIDEIKNVARKNRFVYLTVAPNYLDNDIVPYLEAANFKIKKSELYPRMKINATLLLDLTPPADDLLNQMGSLRRKNINRGLKKDIQFVEGTRNDLEIFFELSNFTAKKYGSYPEIHRLEDLYKIWDLLSPNKWVHLHLGVVEGKTSCASLSFSIGDTFQGRFWGWNGENSNYCITEVFQWKIILFAKEKGYKYFDFVQLDLECAKAISEDKIDDAIKSRRFYGPTWFKMQYGGFVVEYPKVYSYFPNKIKKIIVCDIIVNLMGRVNLNGIIKFIYKAFKK